MDSAPETKRDADIAPSSTPYRNDDVESEVRLLIGTDEQKVLFTKVGVRGRAELPHFKDNHHDYQVSNDMVMHTHPCCDCGNFYKHSHALYSMELREHPNKCSRCMAKSRRCPVRITTKGVAMVCLGILLLSTGVTAYHFLFHWGGFASLREAVGVVGDTLEDTVQLINETESEVIRPLGELAVTELAVIVTDIIAPVVKETVDHFKNNTVPAIERAIDAGEDIGVGALDVITALEQDIGEALEAVANWLHPKHTPPRGRLVHTRVCTPPPWRCIDSAIQGHLKLVIASALVNQSSESMLEVVNATNFTNIQPQIMKQFCNYDRYMTYSVFKRGECKKLFTTCIRGGCLNSHYKTLEGESLVQCLRDRAVGIGSRLSVGGDMTKDYEYRPIGLYKRFFGVDHRIDTDGHCISDDDPYQQYELLDMNCVRVETGWVRMEDPRFVESCL